MRCLTPLIVALLPCLLFVGCDNTTTSADSETTSPAVATAPTEATDEGDSTVGPNTVDAPASPDVDSSGDPPSRPVAPVESPESDSTTAETTGSADETAPAEPQPESADSDAAVTSPPPSESESDDTPAADPQDVPPATDINQEDGGDTTAAPPASEDSPSAPEGNMDDNAPDSVDDGAAAEDDVAETPATERSPDAEPAESETPIEQSTDTLTANEDVGSDDVSTADVDEAIEPTTPVDGESSSTDDETDEAETTTDDLVDDARIADPANAVAASVIASAMEALSDQELFDDFVDNHWRQIFPNGGRNVGGPQFFKYVYENLATSHRQFERYSRFYCGVSGSIVRPRANAGYSVVKVKDLDGRCVVGKYYRCCWPCTCDVMKYARVENVNIRLPLDPESAAKRYYVMTVADPCRGCDGGSCDAIPPEVTAYRCQDGATRNGLRVHNGELTTGTAGRLVFAILHDGAPAAESPVTVDASLMDRCAPRFDATPEELESMGGMGEIFVALSLAGSDEAFTNTDEDLCQ